ncbi:MAG: VOC family protein [Burkholderiales bacterium]|nr:VOC family protein [Burkholderiales bacterium]
MTDPDFILLYVADPLASAAFYARLLGKPALDASPGFAMFGLDSGVKLGLWAAAGVEPAATRPGGAELGFAVADRAAVQARHEAWKRDGLTILQPPTAMDFGYTYTALDPDGHRLRVFTPTAA